VPRPVQSPVGWHVLQLEDQRAYQPPPMEQVRPQLTQAVIQQKLQARIAELRQAAKVE
jgi:peptidyl-prolyl cis-trans isomerase C